MNKDFRLFRLNNSQDPVKSNILDSYVAFKIKLTAKTVNNRSRNFVSIEVNQ